MASKEHSAKVQSLMLLSWNTWLVCQLH